MFNILVVEDNRDLRELLCDALTGEGYRAYSSSDGNEALTRLEEKERLALSRAQEEIKKVPLIPCTTCNYCAKVCPQNIGISGTFTADNYFTLYGNRDMALSQADWLVDRHGRQRADKCVGCGNCEKVCPQHIEIRKELKKSVKELY